MKWLKKIFGLDRGFYRQVVVLALPIALQSLIPIGVNMLDTVVLAIVFAGITLLAPERVMRMHTDSEGIIERGAIYLRYSVVTYFSSDYRWCAQLCYAVSVR